MGGVDGRVSDTFYITTVLTEVIASRKLFCMPAADGRPCPGIAPAYAHTLRSPDMGCGDEQAGGSKVKDAKDIDRLQESLEKVVGTSSRSLQRTASKRPLVGDVSQTGNKSLLYNLMGVLTAAVCVCLDFVSRTITKFMAHPHIPSS